jgi:hypothetical protein
MIGKIRRLVRRLFSELEAIDRGVKENEWANVFHDAVKTSSLARDIPLSIGRWAANYSFLYALYRICSILRTESVLELGLGESSKLVHSVLTETNASGRHLVLEHDDNWRRTFLAEFPHLPADQVLVLSMVTDFFRDEPYNSYSQLTARVDVDAFTVFVVDGPIGTPRHSRHDIVTIAGTFTSQREFIILMDDTQRRGEQETALTLLSTLESCGCRPLRRTLRGRKDQLLLCSERYRTLTTI